MSDNFNELILKNFKRDQFDVVWFDNGFMSKEAYEVLAKRYCLINFIELPLWDSTNGQSIVDISD